MITFLTINIGFALFFLLYKVFLRGLTHYTFNRVYLLASAIVAIALPWLTIPDSVKVAPVLGTVFLSIVEVGQHIDPSIAFGWSFFEGLYAIGFVVALYLLISSFRKIIHGIRSSEDRGEYRLADGDAAWSFFTYIILGRKLSESDREMILRHERVHVHQLHSLDVLFYRILGVVFWFNPFIHWALREVQLNHEYLADRELNADEDYRATMLNRSFGTSIFSMSNSFYSKSTIKSRITMLSKSSSKISQTRYLLFIPLFLSVLWFNSCEQESLTDLPTPPSHSGDVEVLKIAEVMPQYAGGMEALYAYLGQNIKYPESMKESGEEAKVFVQFVVDDKGKIFNVAVRNKNVDQAFQDAAVTAISGMPDWEPATNKGKPVAVEMILPIQFKLASENPEE